ncbi:hypothetical protein HMPREF2966_03855 [Staphylococcus sp. HMSC072D04]|uniref:Uncharacterized protein n=1 Tax=Staphylococcus haemolyticus TaxID=1283 RepID=A0A2K0AWD3_STAHA|nr:hypothetical protein [Staphylococcus haemolyticus]OFM06521.1 hypothetical protein HMPREF2722_10865 [Staphylococcus sp. HMSC074A11]OFM37910.1 hypothetical protein HMPREF2695_08050 [Staphylococcus sp. HMSC076E07]OFP90009.1 hypothetical protein HMPREF2966_03855 [Staphylococcus sp. HMSC072D04]OHQ38201.1 hypothetical protein HMPREF2588_09805 [Staphylococcus sp. HMSC069D04]OHR10044.1 hypothetical protein HMPREF2587_05210 [Staphylococcus sp. HMSC078A08]
MNLKRVNYSLSYYENKISEYTLLTEYNPKFINTKIKAITTQIEIMNEIAKIFNLSRERIRQLLNGLLDKL